MLGGFEGQRPKEPPRQQPTNNKQLAQSPLRVKIVLSLAHKNHDATPYEAQTKDGALARRK